MYYIIIDEVHSACMNQCSSLCITDDLLLHLTVACFLYEQPVYTFCKLSSRAAALFLLFLLAIYAYIEVYTLFNCWIWSHAIIVIPIAETHTIHRVQASEWMYKSGYSNKQYHYVLSYWFHFLFTWQGLHHMAAAWSTKLVSITFNQLRCNDQMVPHWLALISVASDGKLGSTLMARSDATVGPAGDIDEDSQGHRQ